MLRPDRLSHAAEHMDDARDVAVLRTTLDDLTAVNGWLGGTRATLAALDPYLEHGAARRILDIGCGGGDIERAILARADRYGADIDIVAIDRNDVIARIARTRTPDRKAWFLSGDAFALPFTDRAFDIAMMNLTLHHFDKEGRARALTEMARVTNIAVIVTELERSWPNYLGARLLAATLWRNSPYTRHDGPVSVLRGFAPDELGREVALHGFAPARIQRRFFYRLVAVAERLA